MAALAEEPESDTEEDEGDNPAPPAPEKTKEDPLAALGHKLAEIRFGTSITWLVN